MAQNSEYVPKKRRRRSGFAGLPADGKSWGKIATALAAALGGALAGSAVGKLSLLPGLALVGYGVMNDNLPMVAGGATMAMAPEVTSAATSTKTGPMGIAENALNRVKSAGKGVGRKAFLDKVAPGAFSGFGDIEGVDYYGADYQNAMNSIGGMAGADDEMGLLPEAGYNAQELALAGAGYYDISGVDEMDGVEGIGDIDGIGEIRNEDLY